MSFMVKSISSSIFSVQDVVPSEQSSQPISTRIPRKQMILLRSQLLPVFPFEHIGEVLELPRVIIFWVAQLVMMKSDFSTTHEFLETLSFLYFCYKSHIGTSWQHESSFLLFVIGAFLAMDFSVEIIGIFKVLIVRVVDKFCLMLSWNMHTYS